MPFSGLYWSSRYQYSPLVFGSLGETLKRPRSEFDSWNSLSIIVLAKNYWFGNQNGAVEERVGLGERGQSESWRATRKLRRKKRRRWISSGISGGATLGTRLRLRLRLDGQTRTQPGACHGGFRGRPETLLALPPWPGRRSLLPAAMKQRAAFLF